MGKYTKGVYPACVDASVTDNTHSHAVYLSVFLTKLVVTAVLGVNIAACMAG